jgi:hypothetical protein
VKPTSPLFEVAGAGWRASFQRRVGDGVSANRGALPCFTLSRRGSLTRVLVPLAQGEALWLAWIIQAGITVTGHTVSDQALHFVSVTESRDGWRLIAADAIESTKGLRPIDPSALTPAGSRAALNRNHLLFRVFDEAERTAGRLGIALGTPALYACISGFPPPGPTSPEDAYGGWRLP